MKAFFNQLSFKGGICTRKKPHSEYRDGKLSQYEVTHHDCTPEWAKPEQVNLVDITMAKKYLQ